jgi:hypothetical protein
VDYKTRTALLHNPGLLTSLISTLVATLPGGAYPLRFFAGDQREEAIKWLLQSA